MRRAFRAVLICVAVLAARPVVAQPYTDPSLLDMPWGGFSFVKPAWRGYLETVPAVDYLQGLGVVWSQTPPGVTEDTIAARLSAAGFRRVRVEIPWGSVEWDETAFIAGDAERLARILRALKAHGLRPLILLNANHGQPCPVQWRELTVQADAPAGSLVLEARGDLRGAERYPATIMSLADGGTPGPSIDASSLAAAPRLRLSKGLPRAVRAGERLRVALLKYDPLHAVGTTEFERTAAGWLRYVALTTSFVAAHYGSGDFDVEIWNELTFGSAFLDASRYGVGAQGPDPLNPGGRAWELANRTVRSLARDRPSVRTIWGFSNTTFFGTKVPDLPAGIHGQSYHPYGTGRRCFADLVRGKEHLLVDAIVPSGCAVQPEGYAHSWQQTESLVRLIAPGVRDARPPGSAEFRHYITEHGFRPAENALTDVQAALRAKEKFILRAPLLWLGKGITALYVYNAFDGDDRNFGMLGARGEVTPAMTSLQRMTQRLAAASPIERPRPLTIEVEIDSAASRPAPITGRSQRDYVAIVPLQIDSRRFALAAYVMTQDFPMDLRSQAYFIDVTGIVEPVAVTFYSPETDTLEPVEVMSRSATTLRVHVVLTDVPRLIELTEQRSDP
jgi:hypothetical protein